jgi:hypothetical protein
MVAHLLVEGGSAEETVSHVVSKIETTTLFDIDKDKISPDFFLENRSQSVVSQNVVHVLGFVDARMVLYRLASRHPQSSEKVAKGAL